MGVKYCAERRLRGAGICRNFVDSRAICKDARNMAQQDLIYTGSATVQIWVQGAFSADEGVMANAIFCSTFRSSEWTTNLWHVWLESDGRTWLVLYSASA